VNFLCQVLCYQLMNRFQYSILMVLLIFFGAKKIPELAKGLGKGIKEFKNATNEIKDEIEEGVKDIEPK